MQRTFREFMRKVLLRNEKLADSTDTRNSLKHRSLEKNARSMTKETHRGMWGALRPAIRRTSAEELLHARRTETKTSEPAPHTGAFGRIAADVPTVAEEPDLPTGNVPVVPAPQQTTRTGSRHPRTHPHQRLHRLRAPRA